MSDSPLIALFDRYLEYYTTGSDHTARAKARDIQKFLQFLASYRGVAKPEKLSVQDWDHGSVVRFVEDSLRQGEAPSTVTRRLATLKHIGRTLSERLPGFTNPAREVRPPKFKAEVPQALAPRELRKIESLAEKRLHQRSSFIRQRNQMLLHFLLDTGLRVDEVRMMKRGQLDDSLEWLEAVRTKGRRYRNVYVTSSIRAELQRYLAVREKELARFFPKISRKTDRSLPLFVSNYGAKSEDLATFLMSPKTIWRAIRELSGNVKLHPHLLRHTYALDLLDSSNDIRLVAQALGHSDVRVTMKYTERADREVAQALEKARASRSAKDAK